MSRVSTETREERSRRPRRRARKITPTRWEIPQPKPVPVDFFPVINRKPQTGVTKYAFRLGRDDRPDIDPGSVIRAAVEVVFSWYLSEYPEAFRKSKGRTPLPGSADELLGDVRTNARYELAVFARRVGAASLRELGFSFPEIAESFGSGCRSHSTFIGCARKKFPGREKLVNLVLDRMGVTQ